MAWTDITDKVLGDKVSKQDVSELGDNAAYVQDTVLGDPAGNSGLVTFAAGVTMTHVNGMTVTQKATFDGEIKGWRGLACFSTGSAGIGLTSSGRYLGPGGASAAECGIRASRSGSLTGGSFDVQAISFSSAISVDVIAKINTTNAFTIGSFTTSGGGDNDSGYFTQAKGVDTFSANDTLNIFLDITSSGNATLYVMALLEYVLDA